MADNPETIKAAQDKVKAFVRAGEYDKAVEVLSKLNHPKKQAWIDQVNQRRSDREFESALGDLPPAGKTKNMPKVAPSASAGIERTFRIVWGILTLAACGWIAYGVNISRQAAAVTAASAGSDAGVAGAMLGGGLGIGFFLCTGLPFFLLFLVLYWRNGVAITNKRRHAETIAAMQGG